MVGEPHPGDVTLRAGGNIVDVAAGRGGRIGRLVVDGWDVVRSEGPDTLQWGVYPMLPWAGRLAGGVLRWAGGEWSFPRAMPPNAIHGTLLDDAWAVAARDASTVRLRADLVAPWPFGGRATHTIALHADRLELALEVEAGERPMPVIVGWHPWLRRRLRRADQPGTESAEAAIAFRAGGMLEKGAHDIPTGRVVPPPAGPWDDTFVDLAAPPRVTWEGALDLVLESDDAACWVVYNRNPDGVCVEPQTGPPNGLNDGPLGPPPVVAPGRPLRAALTIRWERAGR